MHDLSGSGEEDPSTLRCDRFNGTNENKQDFIVIEDKRWAKSVIDHALQSADTETTLIRMNYEY